MEVQIIKSESEKWLEEYLDRSQPPVLNNCITINLDALRTQNPKCVQAIIQNPTNFYKLVSEWNKARSQGEGKKFNRNVERTEVPRVSFEGNLGTNFVTPRGLNSKMANQLVGIQGIVTRMSIPRFQLKKSVHWCEKTSSNVIKSYPDQYAPEEQFDINKTRTIPTTDIHGNPLFFEFGKSSFKDFQYGVVQQLPEMAPPGLLPRSVNICLQKDIADKIKPGDRVQIIGVYRLIPNYQSKDFGVIKAIFIVTSIVPLLVMPSPLTNSKLSIKLPYPEQKLLELFSQSIAPSIYGQPQLKKAVLLMLLGGEEKTLDNGAHLRGDINLLMIGDPGTAKSQMLRWVLSTVDLGINTTGSGASGVGLTASIGLDKDTGERTIEAGAMVLADRGFVCIDEFDKMDEADRVAVHEVMEQQTVTIAKAGIHCSLNARCSVIAAANPIYGQYQKEKPPTKNIGMPDSLLSRFDLIFIIIDDREADKDKKIAQRVCKNHRYANVELLNQNNVEDGYIIQPAQLTTKNEQMMFEKSTLFKGENKIQILTQGYLKRYISHCRKNIHPVLSDESIDLLSDLWGCLRDKELNQNINMDTKVLPVTIRSYETLIRLSTAHAKLRLSSQIEIVDCVEAFKLVVFSLYKDENALDKQLKEAIRKVMGDNQEFQRKNRTSKKPKVMEEMGSDQKRGKSTKKNDKATENLTKKIQKIDIDKQDQEVDRALYGTNNKKKINSEIFVAFSKLIKGKRNEYCSVNQLLGQFPEMKKTVLIQALKNMDEAGTILYDQEKGNIHSV